MSRRDKKQKIVIPSQDEMAQFGGESARENGPSEERGPAPRDETSPASEDAPEAAAAAGTTESTSEAEQWKDKFLRAKAELVNYQRRSEKERAEAIRFAHGGLVRALLAIIDNLERVVATGKEHPADTKGVVDGVSLTLDNFMKVLRDHGVSVIEAEGRPFDPEVHEAMMQQPSDEHAEPTVLQELARGYRLHDRVLRPAKVIVSRPTESASDSSEESEDADV